MLIGTVSFDYQKTARRQEELLRPLQSQGKMKTAAGHSVSMERNQACHHGSVLKEIRRWKGMKWNLMSGKTGDAEC